MHLQLASLTTSPIWQKIIQLCFGSLTVVLNRRIFRLLWSCLLNVYKSMSEIIVFEPLLKGNIIVQLYSGEATQLNTYRLVVLHWQWAVRNGQLYSNIKLRSFAFSPIKSLSTHTRFLFRCHRQSVARQQTLLKNSIHSHFTSKSRECTQGHGKHKILVSNWEKKFVTWWVKNTVITKIQRPFSCIKNKPAQISWPRDQKRCKRTVWCCNTRPKLYSYFYHVFLCILSLAADLSGRVFF